MSYISIRRIAVICVAAVIFTISAVAQNYKSLIGTWKMTSETDGDPVEWSLVLREVDGKLAAFLTTDSGEQAAKGFTYSEGVLKFQAPYEGESYDIELKVSGDKLDGTWSGNGNSGKTSGARAVTH
jgi:hypothetical protein